MKERERGGEWRALARTILWPRSLGSWEFLVECWMLERSSDSAWAVNDAEDFTVYYLPPHSTRAVTTSRQTIELPARAVLKWVT